MHCSEKEQKADDGEEEHQRRLGQREQATARFGGRGVVLGEGALIVHLGRIMTQMIVPMRPISGSAAVVHQIPCFFRIASMSEKSSLGAPPLP